MISSVSKIFFRRFWNANRTKKCCHVSRYFSTSKKALKSYLFQFKSGNSDIAFKEFLFVLENWVQDSFQLNLIKDRIVILAKCSHHLLIQVELEDEEFCHYSALRCSRIKFVSEMWTNAPSRAALFNQFHNCKLSINSSSSSPSWKIQISKLGHNKESHLADIDSIAIGMGSCFLKTLGSVSLSSPEVEIFYLEDWLSFREESNDYMKKQPKTIQKSQKGMLLLMSIFRILLER